MGKEGDKNYIARYVKGLRSRSNWINSSYTKVNSPVKRKSGFCQVEKKIWISHVKRKRAKQEFSSFSNEFLTGKAKWPKFFYYLNMQGENNRKNVNKRI